MRIAFVGPPGVGKGTQAKRLADFQGLVHISTGDILRDAIKQETPVGKEAKGFIDKGAFVPDEVMIGIIRERFEKKDCAAGFILDGFPRTIPQAEALDRELDATGGIDKVIYIRVSQEEIKKRLSGRLLCRRCQAPYHSEYTPPQRPGVCDRCDGKLFQRKDDTPALVAKRIRVYTAETEPVIQYYRQEGKLAEVDGETTIEGVGTALMAALG